MGGFNPGDDLVELVADRGIAQLHVARHLLEAASHFNKIHDKELVLHAQRRQQGKVETVEEYRVELVCEDESLPDVLVALRTAHPYEVPAYDVVQLVTV